MKSLGFTSVPRSRGEMAKTLSTRNGRSVLQPNVHSAVFPVRLVLQPNGRDAVIIGKGYLL